MGTLLVLMLANIDDLPTELILHILHDERITPMDIYSLGLVSRRLNFIAISLFLELNGIPKIDDSVALSFGRSSLLTTDHYRHYVSPRVASDPKLVLEPEAGILVAFWVSSIRDIRYDIPHSIRDTGPCVHHLERLSLFLSRLQSVKSFTLHFSGGDEYCYNKSNLLPAVPVLLTNALNAILETLKVKGCEYLRLYNKSFYSQSSYWEEGLGSFNDQNSQVTSNPRREKGKNIDRGLFRRMRLKFQRAFSHVNVFRSTPLHTSTSRTVHTLYPKFDPPALGNGKQGNLRCLLIQAPFALLPCCLPGIRNLVHASIDYLTSLTLSYLIFEGQLFDSFLTPLFLNVPNAITHLSILNCRDIAAKSCLQFLSCFQEKLQFLELDKFLSFISDDTNFPEKQNFGALHTLKAPLDWVTYLLTMSDPCKTPLPSLSSLTIQCRATDTFYFSYAVFQPLIDVVLEPLWNRQRACLNLQQDQANVWPAVHPDIDITLEVNLNQDRPWQMEEDRAFLNIQMSHLPPKSKIAPSLAPSYDNELPQSVEDTRVAVSHHSPRTPCHWDLISKLKISSVDPPVNSTQSTILVQWVMALFPCAREVTLPIPDVPWSMSRMESKSRQMDIARDVRMSLGLSLDIYRASRLLFDDEECRPLAWRTLHIGPWSFELEKVDTLSCFSMASLSRVHDYD